MAVILFRIFPQQSHINSTYRLANELKDRGHTIIYAVANSFKYSIESNGFGIYELDAKDDMLVVGIQSKIKIGIRRTLQSYKELSKFVREVEKSINERDFFENMIKNVNPDLILIDGTYKFFSCQLLKYKIKYVFIETTVSTRRRPGIPPLSSSRVPKNTLSNKLLCWLEWVLYFQYPNLKRVLRNYCSKINFPISELDFERYFQPGFKSVPEINTSLLAFDYPYERTPNEYHIPSLKLKRSETSCDLMYTKLSESILINGQKNILCSFGTAAWRYPLHKNFLKTLTHVAKKTPHNFILCIEDEKLRRELRRQQAHNVFVFSKIPQLDLLKSADIMINHGGLNSITECILMGVPMLICPGFKLLDQYGNAGRVKYHGIGIQGTMMDSSNKILKNIKQLLNDTSFKENILSLKNKILHDDSLTAGVVFIESLVIS